MGFFDSFRKTWASSSTPTDDDSTQPPKYETLLTDENFGFEELTAEDLVKEEGPLIEVRIDNESFWIPIRILEEKAPKFYRENRKGNHLVSVNGFLTKDNKMTPKIFVHWLRHGTLPEFDFVKLVEQKQHLKTLTSLTYLFCVAERSDIVPLMDLIMDNLVASKYNFFTPPGLALYYYNATTGPCGLRLFSIRNLVNSLYQHHMKPSHFEFLSKQPKIMEQIFKEMADQGYAGATPKHPIDYPACSYHDARFATME